MYACAFRTFLVILGQKSFITFEGVYLKMTPIKGINNSISNSVTEVITKAIISYCYVLLTAKVHVKASLISDVF